MFRVLGGIKIEILGHEREGIGHGRFGNFFHGSALLRIYVRAGFSVSTPAFLEIVILTPEVLRIFSLVLELWILFFSIYCDFLNYVLMNLFISNVCMF